MHQPVAMYNKRGYEEIRFEHQWDTDFVGGESRDRRVAWDTSESKHVDLDANVDAGRGELHLLVFGTRRFHRVLLHVSLDHLHGHMEDVLFHVAAMVSLGNVGMVTLRVFGSEYTSNCSASPFFEYHIGSFLGGVSLSECILNKIEVPTQLQTQVAAILVCNLLVMNERSIHTIRFQLPRQVGVCECKRLFGALRSNTHIKHIDLDSWGGMPDLLPHHLVFGMNAVIECIANRIKHGHTLNTLTTFVEGSNFLPLYRTTHDMASRIFLRNVFGGAFLGSRNLRCTNDKSPWTLLLTIEAIDQSLAIRHAKSTHLKSKNDDDVDEIWKWFASIGKVLSRSIVMKPAHCSQWEIGQLL
jgi:hypothetical protein